MIYIFVNYGLALKKSKYLVNRIKSYLDLKIFSYIINRTIWFTSKNSFYEKREI